MRDTDLAITFFTILTVLADAATLSIAGAFAAAHSGHDRAWTWLRREVRASGVGIAWVVAAVATSGSLYVSEVAHFVPCRLCWAQRACMYPLVVVLALAARAGSGGRLWRRVALGMSGVGTAIAAYHVLIERFPSLETGTCDPDVPCSLVWFERLGFVTLPFMALSGFVLVATLLLGAGIGPAVTPHPTSPAASVASAAPAPPAEVEVEATRADVPALQEAAR